MSKCRSWFRLLADVLRPYIFVTNGGGKTEQERCLQLSKQLQIEVSPGQFICGHTPMREMAAKYHTVLVVGGEGEKCRQVAEGYGFKDVITPGDIIIDNADTTPFRKLTEEEYKNSRVRNFAEVEIEAIFVFADSRDWASDQQIILNLLMSKRGRLDTRSESFGEGPPIFLLTQRHRLERVSRSHSNRYGRSTRQSRSHVQGRDGKRVEDDRVWQTTNRNLPVRDSASAAVAQRHARHRFAAGHCVFCWRHS